MNASGQPPNPPSPPEWKPEDDGFDFQPTGIEEARLVLDNESISQFDVASAATPAHWKRLRRAARPTDRALTGRAIDWILALPDGLRPQRLSAAFPRIVNELAEVWDDAEVCQETLRRLFDDGRKGRKGFPPEVQAELAALRDWTQFF